MAGEPIVLRQEDVGGQDVELRLVDGKELRVERKGNRSTQSFAVNILVLADKSRLQVRLAWPWPLAGIITIALLLPGSLVSMTGNSFIIGMSQFIGLVFVPACAWMAWKKTVIRQTFCSRSANYPLVRIAPNKPSRHEVDSFIKHVEERMRSYRKFMNLSENDQLAGEMRTLRRLRDEGIVSKRAYNNVKANLFRQFGNKPGK